MVGGAQGQATDMEIQLEEMQLSRLRIEELLSAHTGQPIERVHDDIERDYIVRGDAAVEYGLVDSVITSRESIPGGMLAHPGPPRVPNPLEEID